VADASVSPDAIATAGRSPDEPVARFVGPGYAVAFVAVALAGFAQAITQPDLIATPAASYALAAATVCYGLIGIPVLRHAERRGSRHQVSVTIGALGVLGAAITIATRGYAAMMLLAVASVAVLHLGRRAGLAVSAVLAVVALIAFAERDPLWSAFLQAEIVFGSGVAFVFVFSHVALREHRARRENERLVAQLGEANRQLTAQADHIEQLARAEERNRIARDIHDGLGHYLTVVHIQIEAARTYLTSEPGRTLAALDKAQQLTHEGLCEIRRSVALLRVSDPGELERRRIAAPPPASTAAAGEASISRDLASRDPLVDGGGPRVAADAVSVPAAHVATSLVDAIGALVDDSASSGIATAMRVDGTARRLAEPVELALYRTAQEALTNARRHACASRAAVALVFEDSGTVRIRIEDDGVGARDPADGFGLRGMRERAALVGGTLAVVTAPNRGFAVELEVSG
jgi:signal transduction histidine kinase